MLGDSWIGVVFRSRAVMGVMAPGGPGAGPGPGMPGVRGRLRGWRRRGCRRPRRRGCTPTSHRSATRRPHPAGPARFPRGAPPRPGPRIGVSCVAGRGTRVRAGTAPAGLPAAAGWRGWPGTSPARRRPGGGGPRRGKVSLRGCSGSSSPSSSNTRASRPSPSSRIRRAVAASSGVGRVRAIPRR